MTARSDDIEGCIGQIKEKEENQEKLLKENGVSFIVYQFYG